MKQQKPLPKKLDTKKFMETVGKLGGGIVRIAASHPASIGLLLMAGSAVTLAAARKKESEGSKWGKFIAAEANGLYQGAQAITVTMAAVPIIAAAAGAASSVAESVYGVKAPIEKGPGPK